MVTAIMNEYYNDSPNRNESLIKIEGRNLIYSIHTMINEIKHKKIKWIDPTKRFGEFILDCKRNDVEFSISKYQDRNHVDTLNKSYATKTVARKKFDELNIDEYRPKWIEFLERGAYLEWINIIQSELDIRNMSLCGYKKYTMMGSDTNVENIIFKNRIIGYVDLNNMDSLINVSQKYHLKYEFIKMNKPYSEICDSMKKWIRIDGYSKE